MRVGSLEGHELHDGTEDLLPCDLHVVLNVLKSYWVIAIREEWGERSENHVVLASSNHVAIM